MTKNPTEPVRAVRRVERSLSQMRRESSPEFVHHFRTSVRRLEAVLELVNGEQLPPKLAKAIHKAWRRTSKVRDCDVHLELLKDLHLGPELPAQRELQHWLEERRGRQQRKLEHALEADWTRELARRLQRLRQAWQASPPKLPASPAAEALRRFLEEARRPGPLVEPEGLHTARKRAKLLRYMAELDRDAPHARTIEAGLRRLQGALGAWHDWAELSDTAAAHDGTLRAGRAGAAPPPLLAALRDVTGAKLQQALHESAAVEEELAQLATARRRPPGTAPRLEPRRAASA